MFFDKQTRVFQHWNGVTSATSPEAYTYSVPPVDDERHVELHHRRIFGNHTMTDNPETEAADYTRYAVTVRTDSRLPTSGQPLTSVEINPVLRNDRAFNTVTNYVTLADNFAKHRALRRRRCRAELARHRRLHDQRGLLARTDLEQYLRPANGTARDRRRYTD